MASVMFIVTDILTKLAASRMRPHPVIKQPKGSEQTGLNAISEIFKGETANLNQQLKKKLLESTDTFHEDQKQLQVNRKVALVKKDRMINELIGSLVSVKRGNKNIRVPVEVKLTVEKLKVELFERQELFIKAPDFRMINELRGSLVCMKRGNKALKEKGKKMEQKNRRMRSDTIIKLPKVVEQTGYTVSEIIKSIHVPVEVTLTVEKLKVELVERQELLIKAPNAMEALASDTQIKQLTDEPTEELREFKLKEIEKAETANLSQQSTDRFHEDQQQLQVDMKTALDQKDRMINELRGSLVSMERKNKELRNQLHEKKREEQLNSKRLMDNSLSQLQKLQTKVEDLNESLMATREAAHTAERKWYQAFEQQAEVLKALDVKITALQNSLSAKDMELHQSKQQPSQKKAGPVKQRENTMPT